METKQRTKSYEEEPKEIDPVCGMEVPRASAPAELYWEGQHFYFCSETCKCRFELEPDRYVLYPVDLEAR